MKVVGIYNKAQNIPGYEDIPVDCNGGILFDNGYLLVDQHDQECCEIVYADWGHLQDEAGIMDEEFSQLTIQYKKTGVTIKGKRGYFLPCYNEQNGYYNDRLDLVLFDTNQKVNTCIGWWDGRKQYTPQFKELTRWESVPTKDDIY